MPRLTIMANLEAFPFCILIQTIKKLKKKEQKTYPNQLRLNNSENVRNPELVETLETLVNGWEKQVASALEVQLKKTPQGNGPLAEIDFWRERNANLR